MMTFAASLACVFLLISSVPLHLAALDVEIDVQDQRLFKLMQKTMLLSTSPKNLLQNVISSSIFSSSIHREILDWSTFSHVGIFDPAFLSVLSPFRWFGSTPPLHTPSLCE